MAWGPSPLAYGNIGGPGPITLNTSQATFLVAAVGSYASSAAPTITDSKSNTWVRVSPEPVQGANPRLTLFYCSSPTVGTGHTFTLGTGAYMSFEVAAFGEVGGAGAVLAGAAGTNGVLSSPVTTGTTTPPSNGALIITAVSLDTQLTLALGGSFSVIDQRPYLGGNWFGSALGYMIQGTAAGVSASWSWTGGGGTNICTLIAYALPVGGALAPNLRTTQAVADVVIRTASSLRETQAVVEAIVARTSSLRITNASLDVVLAAPREVRATAAVVEVFLRESTIALRASQVVTEVFILEPPAATPTRLTQDPRLIVVDSASPPQRITQAPRLVVLPTPVILGLGTAPGTSTAVALGIAATKHYGTGSSTGTGDALGIGGGIGPVGIAQVPLEALEAPPSTAHINQEILEVDLAVLSQLNIAFLPVETSLAVLTPLRAAQFGIEVLRSMHCEIAPPPPPPAPICPAEPELPVAEGDPGCTVIVPKTFGTV